MNKLKEVLKTAIDALSLSSTSPKLDAELLLAYALNKNRVYLYTHDTDILSDDARLQYDWLIKERLRGMPIAYLVGEKEFWSLTFEVSEDVLIPRPETEGLVELTLSVLKEKPNCRILELGTGAGAISIALAKEHPDWDIYAVEKSEKALKIAEKNIARCRVENIHLIQSDWFSDVPALNFDAIISNPPYLAVDDPHQYEGDLRFEPSTALLSGHEGFDDLAWIIKNSPPYLLSGAPLILEHGYQQAERLQSIFAQYHYKNIESFRDYAGHLRITCGFK